MNPCKRQWDGQLLIPHLFTSFFLAQLLSPLYSLVMIIRKKIEEKMEKKREEIALLEKQIGESKSYLLALQDALKMIPKTADGESAAQSLRPGTDVSKAYE